MKVSFKQKRSCHLGVPRSILHPLSSLAQRALVQGGSAAAFTVTEHGTHANKASHAFKSKPVTILGLGG